MKAKALAYLDDLFYEGPVPNIEIIPDDVPEDELPDEDQVPMESDWQFRGIGLLLDVIDQCFARRNDFYAGGNMFIYYRLKGALRHMFRGPDFFLVWNTTRQPQRRYWMVWNEGGLVPNVVIELSSKKSLSDDLGEKKDIYERDLKVPEYFCFSENGKVFRGFRLGKRKYKELQPNERGLFWSEQLKLFVGPWRGEIGGNVGTYLRFYHVNGDLVLTTAEANAQRAEQEKAARIALEAELADLRERVTKLEARRNGNGKTHRGNGSKRPPA